MRYRATYMLEEPATQRPLLGTTLTDYVPGPGGIRCLTRSVAEEPSRMLLRNALILLHKEDFEPVGGLMTLLATPLPPPPAYRMEARISIPAPLTCTAMIPFPLSPPSWIDSTTSSPLVDAPPPLPTIQSPTSFPTTFITHLKVIDCGGEPEVKLPPRDDSEEFTALNLLPSIWKADRGVTQRDMSDMGKLRESWEREDDTRRFHDDELRDRDVHWPVAVNMLFRDRRGHAHTRRFMDDERAGMLERLWGNGEAWRRAMDSSDLAHGGVISLRTTVHSQISEITELQSADRRRQRAISELLETDRRRREEMRELRAADRTRQQQIVQTLTAMQTLQREMVPLQGLVTTLQGQVMTLQGQVATLQGQQGPAGGPAQPELPEEAGSSS
ncbi:hypothetical protein Tco_0728138 [Tanacetum coccineum]|uniref:Uncharacterized protein n=1 Tax=Tanacetum coccineum TaxID=301880 RepID=A0ABQ4YL50_9ASTR